MTKAPGKMPIAQKAGKTDALAPLKPTSRGLVGGSKELAVAINWQSIEMDYRAGIKTLRQIAEEHGITHGAVNKRAHRDEWTRDLAAKIRAKADEAVSKTAVSSEVSKARAVSERQVIDSGAQQMVAVRLAQRSDIQRARNLTMSLLSELEVTSDNHELMSQLGTLMDSPDDRGVDKLNELYRKVTSLTGRVSNMKQLAESLKTLVGLEREAFGIDDKNKTIEGEVASLLSSIGKRSAFPVAD